MPNTLPNFPGIDSLNWAPPGQTNPIEVSRKSGPLIIYADADNANYQDMSGASLAVRVLRVSTTGGTAPLRSGTSS
jgi:hypothetical protein